jgi:hypothetical protein
MDFTEVSSLKKRETFSSETTWNTEKEKKRK